MNSPVKDPASSRSAKKALIIALGAVFVLGGGCAILVAVSGNNNNTTQGATTTSTSGQSTKSDEQKLQDELDREAKLFDPADAAFLRDLHGVWHWDFNPDDAVNEAHAMCALPAGKTASALPDIIRMIDPDFQGGDESLSTVQDATKFMKVAGQHFCPGH